MKITALLFAACLRPSIVRSEPEDINAIGVSTADAVCPPVIGGPPNAVCFPDCHCIIDDPADCGTCPDLGDRKTLATAFEDQAFFSGLTVVESSLFRFDPAGCNPFPLVAAQTNQPVCMGVTTTKKTTKKGKKNKKEKNGPVQCSFKYTKYTCDSGEYSIVEEPVPKKKSKKKSKKSKTSVTHEGSCGVCSSAKDLATNLSPTLDVDVYGCVLQGSTLVMNGQLDLVLPSLVQCYGAIGFSPDCAFLWASNALNTMMTVNAAGLALQGGQPFLGPASCLECAATCLATPDVPECQTPMKPGTCDLAPCTQCDEEVSGELFKLYGGRTRRNSGVVTVHEPQGTNFQFFGVKRPCSTIANVAQPALECPA